MVCDGCGPGYGSTTHAHKLWRFMFFKSVCKLAHCFTGSSDKEASQSFVLTTDDEPIRDEEAADLSAPASQYGSVIEEGAIR